MHTLPQLVEEDTRQFDATLEWILDKSRATAAVIADKGGFLIAHRGGGPGLDLTTIAALASGAFMATQTIAGLIEETDFDATFQQGKNSSLYIQSIDQYCMLLVIHPAAVGVGAVKYFAVEATRRIARQIQHAWQRQPEAGLDLSVLNLENPADLFKKR
jgi:predicted regulator of Ras-like GTPase activity (Roadblock/LC7/MglB family)